MPQPRQQSPPNTDLILGSLPPHIHSTTSHEVIGVQPHSDSLLPPFTSQQRSHQLPNIDPQLFLPPHVSLHPSHEVEVPFPSHAPPPPVAPHQRQSLPHSLPSVDPRLGFSHPIASRRVGSLRPTPTHRVNSSRPVSSHKDGFSHPIPSHEVGFQPPSDTLPPAAMSQRYQCPPGINPYLGIPPQHLPGVSHEAEFQSSSENASPTRPSFIPAHSLTHVPSLVSPAPFTRVPLPEINSSSHVTDSECEENDSDDPRTYEPEIDEQSEDEDDRRAHQLLQATMPVTTPVITNSPSVLSYNHDGFSVSQYLIHGHV